MPSLARTGARRARTDDAHVRCCSGRTSPTRPRRRCSGIRRPGGCSPRLPRCRRRRPEQLGHVAPARTGRTRLRAGCRVRPGASTEPSRRGLAGRVSFRAGLALALLAPPQHETACDECAADDHDAEERETGVRKRLRPVWRRLRRCCRLPSPRPSRPSPWCRTDPTPTRATARMQPLRAPGTARRPVRCMQPRRRTRTNEFYPFLNLPLRSIQTS